MLVLECLVLLYIFTKIVLILVSGIGADAGLEHSTCSCKIYADTATPISGVYVCYVLFVFVLE